MKKKLIIAGIALLVLIVAGFQTHTFPALDTNNTWTGTNAFAGITATTFGAVTATSLKTSNLLVSSTAPTISSGFGTSPSVSVNNGTGSFAINVGTGGAATTGVIGLPAATNGWYCMANDITTTSATVFITKQTALGNATTVTIGNFNTSAAAAAWASADTLLVSCFAR